MSNILTALISGTIFGAGLTLSGMTDPARVRGFLNIFGAWDPTLVFVMGGAVFVMALAWMVQRNMTEPLLEEEFKLPGTSKIDAKLIGGAVLFGIGWGIAGLCPGPALAAIVLKPVSAFIFVLAMLAAMALHAFVSARVLGKT